MAEWGWSTVVNQWWTGQRGDGEPCPLVRCAPKGYLLIMAVDLEMDGCGGLGGKVGRPEQ